MAKKPSTIQVTEDQVLYFRARRGHLAGSGAPTAVASARAILGAQAQQLPPALLALSLRTKGRPTATALNRQLLHAPRRLVRTWGQRETLHIYDPAERKLVWRKAAFVSAVVLARGRVVATWSQKKRGRKLSVEVVPLGRWNARKHAAQVRREASALAAHLDLDGAEVTGV